MTDPNRKRSAEENAALNWLRASGEAVHRNRKRSAEENAALKRELEKMREILTQLRAWMERIEDDGR